MPYNSPNNPTQNYPSWYTGEESALTGSATTSSMDSLILDDTKVSNLTIDRSFGSPDDFIELHIYNTNSEKVYSENNFTDFRKYLLKNMYFLFL